MDLSTIDEKKLKMRKRKEKQSQEIFFMSTAGLFLVHISPPVFCPFMLCPERMFLIRQWADWDASAGLLYDWPVLKWRLEEKKAT
ncbi:hypothetical protein BDV29DRAFT_168632 [Aspergillus leporis]|uniref:Uncharacterized protein n=1 Tax=Aspergillus leporis TaxID=41062 RepID=A0A5N5X8Z1_9EURO|nr:hypothetical protein BDV29DRAFT_168632 [Aspergillus leporis]